MAEPRSKAVPITRKLTGDKAKTEAGKKAVRAQNRSSLFKRQPPQGPPDDPPWPPARRVSRTSSGKIVGGESAPKVSPTGARIHGKGERALEAKKHPKGGPNPSVAYMYGQDRPKKARAKPTKPAKPLNTAAGQRALAHKKGLTLRRFGKEGMPLAMGPGDRWEDGTLKVPAKPPSKGKIR